MNPIWVDNEGIVVGEPPFTTIDPGTGGGRYATALAALRSTGRRLAFASFTFDPDEPGSVVIVPARVSAGGDIPASRPGPEPTVVDDGEASWRRGFREAMSAIDAGEVEKVVLARRTTLRTTEPIDTRSVVAALAGADRDDYVFAINGLVGASPELLVSLHDDRVTSLVLAGTAADPAKLSGAKIEEEHRHAVESARSGLAGLLTDVKEKEKIIVPHGSVAHLGTRIVGRARPDTAITDILAALHPTASVAGAPREAAIRLIRRIEENSRGGYAGPIGWFDTDGQGVFALALRCGYVDDTLITLFGGGGLVSGSEEDAELNETLLKLETMLGAVGASMVKPRARSASPSRSAGRPSP